MTIPFYLKHVHSVFIAALILFLVLELFYLICQFFFLCLSPNSEFLLLRSSFFYRLFSFCFLYKTVTKGDNHFCTLCLTNMQEGVAQVHLYSCPSGPWFTSFKTQTKVPSHLSCCFCLFFMVPITWIYFCFSWWEIFRGNKGLWFLYLV